MAVSDPFQVLHHRLAAVADEMGATLRRAAFSTNIKERQDFSCAVFDAKARMIAQAAHIPVHLGAMPASVEAVCHRLPDLGPGDVAVVNDPYAGGSHLPDITTVSPVFTGGDRLIGYVCTRAHHADVGGTRPGSMAQAYDLMAEGLVIPPLRLVRNGRLNEEVLTLIAANSRTSAERRGDLDAQLAAQRHGAEQLARLGADPDKLEADLGRLLSHTEQLTRQRLSGLSAGTYRFEDLMDGDGRGSGALPLCVAITIDARGGMRVDFSGTAPQVRGGLNAPLAVTRSAVYYVVSCLVDDAPINAGMFMPVELLAPPGSLLNPHPPAPVAAGNVETSQRVVDLVLGALQQAAPDIIPAASAGTMSNLALGGRDPVSGQMFTYYETLGGGAGAGPGGPGASGIQVHMTNTRNTPVEAIELAYPVQVVTYRLRHGSGGAGRYRGGEGVERRLRFLADAELTLVADRHVSRPWGLAGGSGAAGGEAWLTHGRRRALAAKVSLSVKAGDEISVLTPGGGGWGPQLAPEGPTI